MRRPLSCLVLASLLLTPPLSARPLGASGGVATAAAPSGAALTRALEAVRPANLAADLYFIASDELGGRDTPSEGLRVAARFLRARLERLGFEPGAPDGFFYEYPLEVRQLDAQSTQLVLEQGGQARALVFGRDYFFSSREIADGTTRGGLVFSGEGDDFEGLDVAGRWVLSWDGSGSNRRRWRNARAAGALGLIVTPGPAYDGEAYAERYGRWAERALEPSVSYPGRRERGEAEEAPFSMVYLTAEAARGLVPEGAARGAALDATVVDTRKAAGDGGQTLVENVCGFWPGSDPALSKEVIILSAHYDHVGVGSDGEVYNGADDNGSGTCGLLAVAEALASYGPMRRSVLLLWVSGEEKGLWGSKAWTENPWLPEGCRPLCNINVDMIGRNAPGELLLTPTKDHEAYNGLARLAYGLAPQEGFTELKSADEYWRRSDHMNFNDNLGIPVAFLFTDVHEDYHRPTDTPDKVDYDKAHRVVRLVVRMLDALQADELDL